MYSGIRHLLLGASVLLLFCGEASASPYFYDTFAGTAGAKLAGGHTSDSGGTWVTSLSAGSSEFQLDGSGNISAQTAYGAGYDCPATDPSSPDMQVWFQLAGVNQSGSSVYRVAVRVQDTDNWIGANIVSSSTEVRLVKDVATSTSVLESYTSAIAGEWFKVKAVGDTISLWRSSGTSQPASPEADTNWIQVGVDHTVTNFDTIAKTCLVNTSGTANNVAWISAFYAANLGTASAIPAIFAPGMRVVQ